MLPFNFIKTFFATFYLDIWDLNYGDSVIRPQLFARATVYGTSKTGTGKRIQAFLFYLYKSIQAIPQILRQKFKPHSIFLFVVTPNHIASLAASLEHLDDAYLICDRDLVSTDYQFPLFWSYLITPLFLPLLIFRIVTAKDKKMVADCMYHGLDRLLLTYGYYVVARIWLSYNRVSALVVASDNEMYFRVMTAAAKAEGIPTIYVQHASVGQRFPPLSFDYALLEGHDSLEIYEQIGTSTTSVYLVGMSKFDKYFQNINREPIARRLGICTNMLDSIENVGNLCKFLREKFDFAVSLRPHPREERMDEWRQLCLDWDLRISEPHEEAVFEFLEGVDVIIAGNSSIHLEATLLNIYPIMFDFADEPEYQAYSFVTKGLCEQLNSFDELAVRLGELREQKVDIRGRAMAYCATVHTEYDGRSAELMSNLIQRISLNHPLPNMEWKRLEQYALEAYAPRQMAESVLDE